MGLKDAVRLVLTAGLVATIWMNAHWSVAGALSLLILDRELETLLLRKAKRGA